MSTLKVDSIVDGGGSGAPTAPNGLTVGTTAIPTAGALSNRNLIINGGLTIWQRGASHAAGSGINYTADRFWRYNPSASGTIERSTDAPDDFEYSLFFNVTGGGNNLGTGVELPRQGFFPQKMYTLSMYLKGDFSGTSIYINYRNSAGSGTDNVDITTFNSFGSYSDWTRVTVPVDTTGITPNANNLFMNMEFGGFPDGGKITGVQLEVGDTATPFEHRSYSDELQRCMRYYYQIGDGTAFGSAESGSGANAYLWAYTFRHPVPMRATPALTLINGGSTYFVGGIGVTIGTPTGDLGTVNTSSMNIATSNKTNVAVHRLGLNGFSFTRGMGYGGTSGFIHCDAEL